MEKKRETSEYTIDSTDVSLCVNFSSDEDEDDPETFELDGLAEIIEMTICTGCNEKCYYANTDRHTTCEGKDCNQRFCSRCMEECQICKKCYCDSCLKKCNGPCQKYLCAAHWNQYIICGNCKRDYCPNCQNENEPVISLCHQCNRNICHDCSYGCVDCLHWSCMKNCHYDNASLNGINQEMVYDKTKTGKRKKTEVSIPMEKEEKHFVCVKCKRNICSYCVNSCEHCQKTEGNEYIYCRRCSEVELIVCGKCNMKICHDCRDYIHLESNECQNNSLVQFMVLEPNKLIFFDKSRVFYRL